MILCYDNPLNFYEKNVVVEKKKLFYVCFEREKFSDSCSLTDAFIIKNSLKNFRLFYARIVPLQKRCFYE